MPVLGLAGRHFGNWKMQVHGGGQSPLPPLWNSFVGTGIHNGPVPPALNWILEWKWHLRLANHHDVKKRKPN